MSKFRRRLMMTAAAGESGPYSGYTIVGSPVIADGIMTVPTRACGIMTPRIFAPGSSTWEIRTKFRLAGTVSWGILHCATLPDVGYKKILTHYVSNSVESVYVGDGNNWKINANFGNRQLNTWYYTRVRFTGTAYYCDYGTDGINFTTALIGNRSDAVASHYVLFGSPNSSEPVINGEFDLNETAIYVDGSLWWEAVPSS